MAITEMPRTRLLRELNKHFSTARIKKTARTLRKLPGDASAGQISEGLSIIRPSGIKAWRENAGRVPAPISRALVEGVRAHLKMVDGGRVRKSAGPQAVRFKIEDGRTFGLHIVQRRAHLEVLLTVVPPSRRRPRRSRK